MRAPARRPVHAAIAGALAASAIGSAHAGPLSVEGAAPPAGGLPAGLESLLAARAAVYEEKTLGFRCRETASEEELRAEGPANERIRERSYLLEREATGEIYRALRGKPGSARLSEASPFPFPEPFAWTQLFDATLRSSFHFVVGEPARLGETTVLPVRFESSAAVEDGRSIREWSGTAWVEPRRGDVLRVVAEPNGQDEALAEAEEVWLRKLRIRIGGSGPHAGGRVVPRSPAPRGREIQVDFAELHDDLLYPSRATLFVFRLAGSGKRVPDGRTLVEYAGYEFFKAEAAAR